MSKNIFQAPCVNPDANENFRDTVLQGVQRQNLPDSVLEEHDFEREFVPIWGTNNESSWERAQSGDLMFFYPESGVFKGVATVVDKVKDADWGAELWPNYEEEPWDLIFVLDNYEEIELDVELFNKLVGYQKTNVPQGFSRVASGKVKEVLERFDSLDRVKEAVSRGELKNMIKNGKNLVNEIVSYIEYYNANGGNYSADEAEEKPEIKDVFTDFRNFVQKSLQSKGLTNVFGLDDNVQLKTQFAGAGSPTNYPDWLWVYPSESPETYPETLMPIVLISGKQRVDENNKEVECFFGLNYRIKGSTNETVKNNLVSLLELGEQLDRLNIYETASSKNDKGEVWEKVTDFEKVKNKVTNSPSSWPHYGLGLRKSLSLENDSQFQGDFENLLEEVSKELTTSTPKPGTSSEDSGERIEIPLKELIASFSNYLQSKGFYFEDGEIKNFVLSLKTKPFVILAGISGTGKTKLASLFADFIDAEKRLISVKPNWTDNSDLLGYQDISGEFRKQTMTELLISANKEENKNKPHFAILDEMNLARVEHYFSDFLSKMETRKRKNDRLQSDAVFDEEFVGGLDDGGELSHLRITDNFYVVGTVNMDETTHPFSRKVLDRANSLEFTEVHLDKVDMKSSNVSETPLENDVISPDYLRLSQLYENKPGLFDEIISNLERINNILREGDFQVGYRVRDEACIYVYYAVREDILTQEEAFDFQLKQKILPRLQGSTETIASVLRNLYSFCVREEGPFPGDWNNNQDIKQELSAFNNDNYLYPRSAKKIMRMQRRYLEQTFTSFWI